MNAEGSMGYSGNFRRLAQSFEPVERGDARSADLGDGTRIESYAATSDTSVYGQYPDGGIAENRRFDYYLLTRSGARNRGVILFFHGLNEKWWGKYLPWANALCALTGKSVLLFPIAFHMNRAPAAWSDPREMSRVSNERKKRHPQIVASSFANAALSTRLEEFPERFLLSGYQTYADIIRLVGEIRRGEHPAIGANESIDLFGYSIGAFLAEVLVFENHGGYFRDSRAFLFCGGATLSGMRPVSRFILDSAAGARVSDYFGRRFDVDSKVNQAISRIFDRLRHLGDVFKSLLSTQRLPELREDRLRSAGRRITALTLAADSVVPNRSVLETLRPSSMPVGGADGPAVHILDFPYPYSHEQPFPLLPERAGDVDGAFETVFEIAAAALR